MIKIAICDDEVDELNITRTMCDELLSENPEYDVRISSFSSPEELMHSIVMQEGYDILMLDIYMPGKSGTELAKEVRNLDKECQIVFLTTSMAHAVEAFSLHAAHYLVKPYSRQQFSDALTKAITSVDKNRKAQLALKVSGGIQKVRFNELIYSETERHNQLLHLLGGNTIRVRLKSSELYEMLCVDGRFFKCGSTYIINLDLVKELTGKDIIFENDERVPMLRRQYKCLLDEYTKYSLGF